MRVRARLRQGLVIPAHPLALTARRGFDERYQRALTRYYLAAGAGGLAVGVHTTQFAIRKPNVGLYTPVLALAAETARTSVSSPVLIAGICGRTPQALREARIAKDLGYHAGLVSLGGLGSLSDAALVAHCRAVAKTIPLIGFYLQLAAGGRDLGLPFWRQFLAIENVVAIKVAPFDRYRTLDVVRALAESGRTDDVALYTGNDDQILLDLLTPFRPQGGTRPIRFAGGLLGQYAVWTQRAVGLQHQVRRLRGKPVPGSMLSLAAQLTEANGAIFDAANRFRGCIPGIHEILRRQGLLRGTWCLDTDEILSPGQRAEIDRVTKAYPHLTDDAFVAEHLDTWLT